MAEETTSTKGLEEHAIEQNHHSQGAETMSKGGEHDDKEGEEEEEVEPEVDEATVEQLQEMGFSRNRAVRAIYCTGCTSVEQLVEWIGEHQDDEDIDEPLRVKKAEAQKRNRSKEEIKAILDRKRRQAKERREKLDVQRDVEAEKERIRSGKELAAARRAEEEQRLRHIEEQRKMERQEQERAREKIRERLEEDRRARRRAMGLPDELTEEEKQREEELRKESEREAKREEERKARAGLVLRPAHVVQRARSLLADIRQKQEKPAADTCFSTLRKVCKNLWDDPDSEKFRTLRPNNSAIQERIVKPGGLPVLEFAGFKEAHSDGESKLFLDRDDVDMVRPLPFLRFRVELDRAFLALAAERSQHAHGRD